MISEQFLSSWIHSYTYKLYFMKHLPHRAQEILLLSFENSQIHPSQIKSAFPFHFFLCLIKNQDNKKIVFEYTIYFRQRILQR